MLENLLENYTISPVVLINNGYNMHKHPFRNSNTYVNSYQKKVHSPQNDGGVLYFINLDYHYLSPDIIDNYPGNRLSLTCEMQLVSLKENITTNISFTLSDSHTLQDLENYCQSMFIKMDFQQYDYGYKYTYEKHLQNFEEKQIKKEKDYLLENTHSDSSIKMDKAVVNKI